MNDVNNFADNGALNPCRQVFFILSMTCFQFIFTPFKMHWSFLPAPLGRVMHTPIQSMSFSGINCWAVNVLYCTSLFLSFCSPSSQATFQMKNHERMKQAIMNQKNTLLQRNSTWNPNSTGRRAKWTSSVPPMKLKNHHKVSRGYDPCVEKYTISKLD